MREHKGLEGRGNKRQQQHFKDEFFALFALNAWH
jgi:hypothetical protein